MQTSRSAATRGPIKWVGLIVCFDPTYSQQTRKNAMFQFLRIDKALAPILLFVFVGCSHGAEPPSPPVGALRPTSAPARFVKPDGSPLNVAADGSLVEGLVVARCVINEEGHVEQCKIIQNPFATANDDFVAVLQMQKYTPPLFEGKPQRVNYTFRTRFKGADEYTNDLRKICHVHEITGKSPKLGLQAVAQWLIDNIKTPAARKRLSELPTADIPVWLQALRRDASEKGISPCPFADTWEEFLKRPASDGESQ